MKEFNENPFKKDTEVICFSNGTEAMVYSEMNCYNCINYESESTKEEDAKCKLAFNLDLGQLEGSIPLWVAKELGCKYDPLYQTAKLNTKCSKFNDGNNPF